LLQRLRANRKRSVKPAGRGRRKNQWRVRMSAPVSGRWFLMPGITIPASDTVNVASPILIM
jgi:hypothetical protein